MIDSMNKKLSNCAAGESLIQKESLNRAATTNAAKVLSSGISSMEDAPRSAVAEKPSKPTPHQYKTEYMDWIDTTWYEMVHAEELLFFNIPKKLN